MTIRIFLNGCQGRMGHMISEIAAAAGDLQIVAGSDLNPAASALPYPVYADPCDCAVEFDVLIDFSNPAAVPGLPTSRLAAENANPSIGPETGTPKRS